MNKKEKTAQTAVGTLFECQGCGKVKSISQKSDGGVYALLNFCTPCLKIVMPGIPRLVLSERNYKKWGYVIRHELWDDSEWSNDGGIFINQAYTFQGDHIGETKLAYYFCNKLGIAPELKHKHSQICTIGYSAKDKKYYGWSHRATFGFAIGDKIFEENFGKDDTLFKVHGRKTIKNKEDQRKAAVAFADYVS